VPKAATGAASRINQAVAQDLVYTFEIIMTAKSAHRRPRVGAERLLLLVVAGMHSGYLNVQACTHTRIRSVQRSGRLDNTVFLPGDDFIEKSLHPFLSQRGVLEVDKHDTLSAWLAPASDTAALLSRCHLAVEVGVVEKVTLSTEEAHSPPANIAMLEELPLYSVRICETQPHAVFEMLPAVLYGSLRWGTVSFKPAPPACAV